MFVLGIDPGLSRCGYGVIEISQRKESAIAAGTFPASGKVAHRSPGAFFVLRGPFSLPVAGVVCN